MDFDGDGDLECLALLPIDLTTSDFVVFELGPTGVTEVGRWPVTGYVVFACADFDGDGRDDVVYSTTSGLAMMSLQTPGQLTPLGPPVPGLMWNGVPADLDGDGDVDVVSWTSSSSPDLVFGENVGGGVLTPRPGRIPSSTTTARPTHVAIADMDGDGDLDLVALKSSWNWVRVYENVGGATFAARADVLASGWLSRVEAVDLDGDGDTDAAVYASRSPRDFMWNDGTGALTPTTFPLYTGDGGGFADVDGDGDADVAFANMMSRIAQIAIADGRGGFERQFVLPLFSANNGSTDADVRFGDLDGDGDLDFVLLLNLRLYVAFSRLR